MVKLFRATRSLQMALFAAFLLCAVALVITAPASAKTKFSISVEPVLEVSIPDPDVVLQANPDDITYTADLNMNVVSNNQTGYTIGIFLRNGMTNASSGSELQNSYFYFYDLKYSTKEYYNLYSTSSWAVQPSERAVGRTFDEGYFNSYKSTDSPTPTSGVNEKITFGARINQRTASGVYDGDLIVTVVANYIPKTIYSIKYMQEVDSDVIESMQANKEYQIRDQRDDKYYWVAKMDDGHIWMTQNLDFEISDEGTRLDPQTTDVVAAKTISNHQNGIQQASEGDIYYKNGTDKGPVTDFSDDSVDLHYNAGSEYSWLAATAGGSIDASGREVNESICPKGWTLPTYSGNLQDYGYYFTDPRSVLGFTERRSDKSLVGAPFYGIANSEGEFWSSSTKLESYLQRVYSINVRNTPNAKGQYFDENYSLVASNKRVRCVTKIPRVVKFGRDSEYNDSVLPNDIVINDTYYTFEKRLDILGLTPTPTTYRNGDYLYTFVGWNTAYRYEHGVPIGLGDDDIIRFYRCTETSYNYICDLYINDGKVWADNYDILIVPYYDSVYDPQ